MLLSRFPRRLGISVRAPREIQEENVFRLASTTTEKLACPGVVQRDDIVANSDYVSEGYGFPTPGGIEAIKLFAQLEAILLDPVYSSKGAAGLIDLIRKDHFTKRERIVFLHTGGSASLFGYMSAFESEQNSIRCGAVSMTILLLSGNFLSCLFDIRIPLTFSLQDCKHIAIIIKECTHYCRCHHG